MKKTIGNHRVFARTGANFKLFYSNIIISLAIMMVALHSSADLSAGNADTLPETASDYSRLVQFIRLEDKVKVIFQ
ncbi:MAG: hypothetical protein PVG84_15900 [Desulfobacterales bacterium]|jgi:hypothetical protein